MRATVQDLLHVSGQAAWWTAQAAWWGRRGDFAQAGLCVRIAHEEADEAEALTLELVESSMIDDDSDPWPPQAPAAPPIIAEVRRFRGLTHVTIEHSGTRSTCTLRELLDGDQPDRAMAARAIRIMSGNPTEATVGGFLLLRWAP